VLYKITINALQIYKNYMQIHILLDQTDFHHHNYRLTVQK